jgi:hypothetical protein
VIELCAHKGAHARDESTAKGPLPRAPDALIVFYLRAD